MAGKDMNENHDAINMSPTSHVDHSETKENIFTIMSTSGRPEKVTAMSSGAVKNHSRWVAVCLGLLCVLLLALTIVLGVRYITEKVQFQGEKDHLLASYVNVTKEKEHIQTDMDHLQASYVNVTMERDQLDAERKNLLVSHVNVTMERDQLEAERENLLESYVNVTMERDQLDAKRKTLLANYVNVTMERDQLDAERKTLLSSYENVTMERDLLEAERENLLESYGNVTMERDQISATNTNLSRQVEELRITNGQLQDRISKLQKKCPTGWSYFNTKCYFRSFSLKNWSESRQECQLKGGDLVSINSKEEQVFIHGLKTSWIGLNKINGVWEWVDNTKLSTSYWDQGQGLGSEDCVLGTAYTVNPFSSWHDYPCNHKDVFICELSSYM